MSEMVERVARAMCLHDHGFDIWEDQAQMVRDQYLKRTRASIEAMREPTEAMINSPMARCYNDGPYGNKEVRRIFSSMIDEALK